MKIKAKKTNSASENAIRSSYFVIQSRKLMHLSRSTLINETIATSVEHVRQCAFFTVDGASRTVWSQKKNIDQSYQWPATLPAGLF